MGGGGTTTQQSSGSQASIQQIPAWMSNAGQQNYAYAQDIANRPLMQYQGAMVPDTAPQSQQAWNLAAGSGSVGQPAYNAAQAGYLSAINQVPYTINPNGNWVKSPGAAAAITDPGNAMQVTDPGSAMQVNDPGTAMQLTNPGTTMQVYNPGNANQIAAGQLADTNLQPYLNPFTQEVINKTLPIMQQNLGLQQNQAQNAAAAAGAYGGSRQGVQQGVTQAQGAQNMAQMAGQLNAANFAQAQQGAMGDIASRLQAAQSNQASQQTDLARALQAQLANQGANATDLARALQMGQYNQASQQMDLARSLQAQGMNQASQQTDLARTLQSQLANQASQQTDLQRLWQTGATNQASQQTDLARQMQARLANQGYALTAQQANQNAALARMQASIQAAGGLAGLGQAQQKGLASQYAMLSAAGAGQQQQAQDQINAQIAKFNQAYNYPQQGLGLMMSSLGMTPHDVSQFGTTNQTTTTQAPSSPLSTGLQGLDALGSIWSMSDPKVKTSITPMGKDPVTGVPIKAFRFKGEHPATPKVIGPLAGDVEKAFPGSTMKIGGVRHVPRPALAAATPSVARLPSFSANTMRGPLAQPPRIRPRVMGALGG